MKDYAAYFSDIAPGEVYGFPPTRTYPNHGYDPVTQDYYQWYTYMYNANNDSKDRYNVIHDHIKGHSDSQELIGAAEAVRISSAVGMKGGETNEDAVCDPSLYAKGIGVLSVTCLYDMTPLLAPSTLPSRTCGRHNSWVPAANPYVKIDMTPK